MARLAKISSLPAVTLITSYDRLRYILIVK